MDGVREAAAVGAPAAWTDLDAIAYHAGALAGRRACVDLRTGETLTYGELDRLVAQGVAWLAARVVEPFGARVATIARNGLESLVLMYACERSGAIFTPLNWRLTAAEIAELADDAKPALILFDAEFSDQAEAAGKAWPAAVLASSAGVRAEFAACEPAAARPGAPGAPCVILYTSGTTGRPKGVMITRAGIFWNAFNFTAIGDVSRHSVMLCDTPMFHTVGLMATCRCILQCGGTLLLSDRFTPGGALARLSDPVLCVTHFFGVPQIAQMLRDDPAWATADFSRLKGLFLGGAPLPTALCNALLADGVTVVNGYGSTEAGTVAHMPIDPDATRAKPGSVGLLVPAMEIRIVDADGAAVPVGATGEVWLRGPAITPGYWNQPEASAKALEDGWFHTGDAGYRDEEGYLFLVDRWKDMYISGGENVYPAEVENAIGLLAGVREVGVVGVADARWGEVGVAFVVAQPGADLAAADVQAHCQPLIARYKHPAHVRFIEALPRTASGKLRKDELRRLFAQPE